MPLDKIDECMAIIKAKTRLDTSFWPGKNVDDLINYFEGHV